MKMDPRGDEEKSLTALCLSLAVVLMVLMGLMVPVVLHRLPGRNSLLLGWVRSVVRLLAFLWTQPV